MIIAERLKILRRERGLTKKDLISALPINYSTYANYESGLREPNSEVLQMLAKYFGVSIDYLMGLTDNRKKADEIAILTDDEHDHIMKFRQLDKHGKEMVTVVLQKEAERINFPNPAPLSDQKQIIDEQWVVLKVYQQRASAGLGSYLSDDSDGDYEEVRFKATDVSTQADFCMKIKGDSMEPKICDGDIVFVKAVPKVDPGNVGIFIYNGEAFCKRLRLDTKKGSIYLDSLNKSFAPKEIKNPDSLRTVGVVTGLAE